MERRIFGIFRLLLCDFSDFNEYVSERKSWKQVRFIS